MSWKRVALSAAIAGSTAGASAQEDEAVRHAREILRRAPLVDTHNDLPWLIREAAGSDVAKSPTTSCGAWPRTGAS